MPVLGVGQFDEFPVVTRDDDRTPRLGERQQQRMNLRPRRGVEVGGRLIEQQEPRRQHPRARERHFLPLAAGKLRRRDVAHALESCPRNRRVDTARGRRWSPLRHRNDGQEGENFQAQWKHALIVRPRFVIIKSWNEWITYGPEHTDEFNPEFSNDLEPMEGGHGDYYYRLLAEYVRIFKR